MIPVFSEHFCQDNSCKINTWNIHKKSPETIYPGINRSLDFTVSMTSGISFGGLPLFLIRSVFVGGIISSIQLDLLEYSLDTT